MEKYSGRKKRLAAGGSVSTTAWDFCRLLSKGNLFCGGLDLGFPNNRTHFHGSFFEEKVHTETSRKFPPENFAYSYISSGNTFLSKNNKELTTLTDQRLSIYIKWFEEQIKINKIKNNWNISPFGIKIEGMDYKNIEELLTYPEIRSEIDNISKNITQNSNTEITAVRKELTKGVDILEHEFTRLLTLSKKALLLISKYKSGNRDNSKIKNLVKELDLIDKLILETKSSQISSFLLQPIINEISEKGKAETFDEGIDNSEDLYLKIKDSANFHRSLVLSYLENIQNQLQ